MDLAQYQIEAQKTALPTALHREYLVPMIIGEIGELFGQRAKAVRDGWDPERLQKMLISEYGDICWGTAVLLRIVGVCGEAGYQYPVSPDPGSSLLSHATGLYVANDGGSDEAWIDDAAEALWFSLKYHCQGVTGVSFDEVLAANLAKLADRAARKALQGSGDHR